jgi:hypothetical protein
MTSTNLGTEFLLQFRKQQEDSAILLPSNRPQQQEQDKKRLTEREKKTTERTTAKNYEQVGLQEAPHLQDLKQNHFANAKSRISKKEFSLIGKAEKQKSRGRKTKPLKTEVDQAMV